MIGIIVCAEECNLACKYCYEHLDPCRERESRDRVNSVFRARLDDVKRFVSDVSAAAARANRPTQFILHGGEPLLLRGELLAEVFDFIARTADARIQVQTNGTLADAAFSGLCKEYGVSVTVSVDGPERLHDRYRVDAGGRGTLGRILSAVELLKGDGVPVNALATITSEACGMAEEIFAFFDGLETDFSVNRCFPVQGRRGSGGAADEAAYRVFLSQLYDIYQRTDGRRIHIPCFDRCLHDLKEKDGAYVYKPGSSPELAVYQCTTGTVYRPFRERGTRVYTGAKKACVLDHLCWQQERDYANAVELNAWDHEKGWENA